MTAVQEMKTEMKTIKAAQAKQTEETQNLQDEMRKQRELNQEMEKQHDESLRKVQDQLKEGKMAREAAEQKGNTLKYRIQELEERHVGPMKTSQDLRQQDQTEEKMAREAAERKIQALEKPDAGHMETSQGLTEQDQTVSGDFKTGVYQQAGDEAEQHGASSDVKEMGTTATVRAADDSVPHQGVTQKDSNPRHVDALLDACCDGDMAEVKRVLDLGQVDVNYRGGRSLTPVMMAALGGYREMVELLLSRGADVSLVDVVGNNTLHWACVGGDVGTVELILSQDGVDVNARNNDGETAADVASGRGHQLVDLVSRAAR
ncbi:protein TANC1-like isoform X6 [Haliotis rubra]|uniref:protein TANC1-like isoform X6 n=1 Tax=Haliotis rubra TaxID=36100 RepID=UPI001EE58F6F|nr:protein TANC1-like isoform X6 [Haliotis rubra]